MRLHRVPRSGQTHTGHQQIRQIRKRTENAHDFDHVQTLAFFRMAWGLGQTPALRLDEHRGHSCKSQVPPSLDRGGPPGGDALAALRFPVHALDQLLRGAEKPTP